MSTIIHIETSTDVCSVALSEDGHCIFHRENREGHSHARVLAPFVEEAVSMADSHAIPIDAVAASCGPGSYTGLRIGVSTAKGLCYGRGLKLIGVSTLKLLCVPILLYREDLPDDALLCPMLDARRMEVYTAIYDRTLNTILNTSAQIITPESFLDILDKRTVVFAGNGAAKCKGTITHPNAIFADGVEPLAKNMIPLAERSLMRGEIEDTAYFEPFYLKEFVAGQPRKLF